MKKNSNTEYKGVYGVSNYACSNISITNTTIRQAGLISPKTKAPSLVQAIHLVD